ncbi:hypothetical protein CHH28_04980 [Bacterioplanes sanyensis]|uniref:Outer membrane protein beta-barrel domain-containing protein n=1 Tax=Bacterioplanes sanyensis TaxID=1249553 RepID=A0A222FIM1_9GAMM|nr:outer membrane beta-barrel protein [Bacterioplanes sanyensis]ASP38073.1 hypothetical protein CHH28_04980 [Bacterioplanes sanyensis]
MKKTLLAAALLASVNASAMQLDLDNKYVGGSLHLTDFGVSGFDSAVGFGVLAGAPLKGVNLPANVSLTPEAGFVYFGTSSNDEGTFSTIDVEYSGYSVLGAMKASLAFNEQVSGHVKGGLNYVNVEAEVSSSTSFFSYSASSEASEIKLLLGLGGEFKATEKLSIVADYTLYASDISSLSAGVNFKF